MVNTRPGAEKELWCNLLLPISIICSNYHTIGSGTSTVLCVLSLGVTIAFLWKELCISEKNHYLWINVITCAISTILLLILTNYSLHLILLAVFVSVFTFEWLYKTLIMTTCFTVSEAAIVAQSCVLVVADFPLHEATVVQFPEVVQFTLFSKVILLGCFLLTFLLYHYPVLRAFWIFYFVSGLVACGFLALAAFYLEQNPLVWLFYVCTASKKRVFLIASWIALTLASITYVVQHVKRHKTVSTLIRKYFHIIVMSVYIPGLILDPAFLYLASVVALSVFIILEAIRVLLIPPLGIILFNSFSTFVDEKDAGVLILSNIYLLIGCSCPLWLLPPQDNVHISHWSGIISVGLGDMVAAIAGTMYGKHKWSGSNKTVEGTFFAAIAQAIALVIILYIGEHLTISNSIIVISTSIVTSLIEARTTQVDNLILPLLMFPLLSFVKV